jgi:hypothetical protein
MLVALKWDSLQRHNHTDICWADPLLLLLL